MERVLFNFHKKILSSAKINNIFCLFRILYYYYYNEYVSVGSLSIHKYNYPLSANSKYVEGISF